jgi:hypothetical protein
MPAIVTSPVVGKLMVRAYGLFGSFVQDALTPNEPVVNPESPAFTVFVIVRDPADRLFVNVQTVSRPDWIVRLSTPVGVGVPLAVEGWITQEAESSLNPPGTASFRSRVVVGAYGISDTDPLPLIVQVLASFVEAAEALNVNACVLPAGAFLTMVRKPLPGVTTQSKGLLFPSFPAEGYEQTLMNLAVAGMSELAMLQVAVRSAG